MRIRGKLSVQCLSLLLFLRCQGLIINIGCLLLFLLSCLRSLLERHGELGEVALYVFLKEFCTELEVLHGVIIGEERVKVGDEVFPVELHHLIIEIDLRKNLQVSVQVQGHINDRGFVKKLHQMRVIFEVSS
jgi:hypothetical protein